MKCYSKPLFEKKAGNKTAIQQKTVNPYQEVPLADEGQLEQTIAYWQQRENFLNRQTPTENADSSHQQNKQGRVNQCYVVSVVAPDALHSEGQFAEILGLVKAQGDQIKGQELYGLSQINPKTYLGIGIAEVMASRAIEAGANMLVLDADLTPSQMRNLENLMGIAICDREAVILNVFLSHAKTRQARIQVEMAHLEYLRPRIRGLGMNMDQQAGGVMGSRGPGETASELMARRLDGRMKQLQKAAKKLAQSGRSQRKKRVNCYRTVLVGYTNAGKTSLMNALTLADLSARNLPFETLDTTTRRITQNISQTDILISDTVGFIRNLPERLWASFASTLTEIQEANLLLIVVDISDPEIELQIKTTEQMLQKLNAQQLPRFYVFNQMDKVSQLPSQNHFERLSGSHPFRLVSCLDLESVALLKQEILRVASGERETLELFVPYTARSLLKTIYANCHIVDTQSDSSGLNFVIQGEAKVLNRIQQCSEEIQQ